MFPFFRGHIPIVLPVTQCLNTVLSYAVSRFLVGKEGQLETSRHNVHPHLIHHGECAQEAPACGRE